MSEHGSLESTIARVLGARPEVLGRNDVDLVVLNDAPPLLWKEVLAHGTRLASRDPVARTTREGQAWSRWCDWKPVQDRIDALLLARKT